MGQRLNVLIGVAAMSLPFAAFAQQDGQSKAEAATHATSKPKVKKQASPEPRAEASSDAGAEATAGPANLTKADVKAGATVYDLQGNSVGTIESVDGEGAILNTGTTKVKVPVASFAQGDKGLAISMSKAEIEAAARK